MSRSSEYNYRLEQRLQREIERQIRLERQQAEYEARRRVNEDRIRRNTEQFYQRYMQQYEDMRSQNFDTYIPEEMERLRSDLDQIRSLLYSDPGSAREISFRVGEYIYSMFSTGHAAEREFQRREIEAERQRREVAKAERLRQQSELNDAYYSVIAEIHDQAVINFASKELADLRQRAVESSNMMSIAELKKLANEIIVKAKAKADEWAINDKNEEHKQIVTERLQLMREQLEQNRIENQEKAQALLSHINDLQNSLQQNNMSQSDLDNSLEQVEAEMDDTLISEKVRREAVKAIYQSLTKQGFQVQPPQLIADNDQNYVRIIAKRPSGKRVQCRLDLHGKLAYKFDEYEGMTCLKDIEKFNVELERAYSVILSDERVIWENPDRLSKDYNSTSDPKRRNQ